MLWRRWKKKAKMKVFSQPVSPSGVPWLDRFISTIFGLKGDLVPDFRLIDYLVCLMSTYSSPALNGAYGNSASLKKDLEDLGVFHSQMSLYLLYKLREFDVMGFSGFEGRHYSLFESFSEDMGRACSLQNLITGLAFKYMISRECSHHTIPDDPFVESERRQIIFCSALGIPTFYVRSDTGNLFLKKVLARTTKVLSSRRYPGYLRVELSDYRKALCNVLAEDGAPLIEMFGMSETLADLSERVNDFDACSVSSRLIRAIVNGKGIRSALNRESEKFNLAAEEYYRKDLKRKHMAEALSYLKEDITSIDKGILIPEEPLAKTLNFLLEGGRAIQAIETMGSEVLEDRIGLEHLVKLIHLVLAVERADQRATENEEVDNDIPPVCRAGSS